MIIVDETIAANVLQMKKLNLQDTANFFPSDFCMKSNDQRFEEGIYSSNTQLYTTWTENVQLLPDRKVDSFRAHCDTNVCAMARSRMAPNN